MTGSRFWTKIQALALPLGSVQGVPIRLHVLFFLLFPVGLLVSDGNVAWSVALTAVTFVLVLFHECGHLLTARLAGCFYDEMVIWPLGGLISAETPLRPLAQFVVAAAGPLVHLAIFLLFLPWVVGQPHLTLWPEPGRGYATLVVGVNQILLVANLIPAFSTDGGRIWQSFLWHFVGYRRATFLTVVCSLLVGSAAVWYGITFNTTPAALPVGLAGGLLIVSSFLYYRGQRVAEVIDGQWIETPCFFSGSYRRRRLRVRFRHWRGKRRQERDHLQRVKDFQELDAILHKISKVGLNGLTNRERRFLQKQSYRLKRRRGISLR
jgi:Zn-dependent protease